MFRPIFPAPPARTPEHLDMAAHPNSFKARKTLKVGTKSYTYDSLAAAA